MPSHRHYVGTDHDVAQGRWGNSVHSNTNGGSGSGDSTVGCQANQLVSATGGNAAHNNMPSYQTLYAWRRTA